MSIPNPAAPASPAHDRQASRLPFAATRAILIVVMCAIAAFVAWVPVVRADEGLEAKAKSLSQLVELGGASYAPYGRIDELQLRQLERVPLGTVVFGHSAGAIVLLRTENGLAVERLTRDGADNGRFTVYRHQEIGPAEVPADVLTADEKQAHARDFGARGGKPASYTTGGYDG